ncbi:ABC transporter substrate-binding protein [Aneurinibacillus sp. Ricciae_BoGa-3]|uniref:ABC transporter substrate-binding protein n=1 Tax=Aneurinibacillus sp. Ricciae_BoGa-3 TaxID=3022697 RepID=UPI00234149F4|nr:ABC transporter substrate-binding protein [Aneurinibacillus sp. Ricciae_BoGa-3]WCK52313.1 ABC transporter substrate-binding protein [Aneurinibacillus sp. Ricciae_BoGa-3]
MSKLPLSFACWDYDRIRALTDGTTEPKGIDLNWLNLPVEETFWRMMRHQEFDVSELSLSSYLIAKDRGYPKLTAIPVFMSRAFRHSGIYINRHSGIKEPQDLRGKRVGIPEYQLTACLWIRGILHHDYGVSPTDIEWFMGGEETPGRIEKVKLDLPSDIQIRSINDDQTLNQMLEDGMIDAIIAPRAPSCFLNGSPNVQRLFPDFVSVEKDYYTRTGIFPIMHVVAIKDEILEKHPWVAANLYQAFVAAKQKVYDGFKQTAALKVTLPWLISEWQNTKELMGEDFWPYGLDKNRTTLEAAVSYSYEQGMIKRKLDIEELFVKSTLEEYTV